MHRQGRKPYKLYRRIQLPIERAVSLCMCRHLRAVAVAGDNSLGLIDLEGNTLSHTVAAAHSEPIIQICSDGECTLATISHDKLLSFWRIPTTAENGQNEIITKIGSIALPAPPLCCAMAPGSGVVAVGCERALLLISLKGLTFDRKGKKRSLIGLSSTFARCHRLHACDVTAVAFSRDGRFVLSGDIDGCVNVASIAEVPAWNSATGLDMAMDEEIETAESKCFRAAYCVDECVSSLKHIDRDIVFAVTSTDHVAAFRVLPLIDQDSAQNCTVLERSAAVRNYKPLWEEDTAPSIVTALFEPTTSRAFVLASSANGRLMLFNVDEEVAPFVGFETSTETPVAHSNLVRASEYCGSATVVTCGDDGRLCVWKLMMGDRGSGTTKKERQRSTPY